VENLEIERSDRRDGSRYLNDAAWPWIAVLATVAEFLSLGESMVGGMLVRGGLAEGASLEGALVVLEETRSVKNERYRDTSDVAGLVISDMV